MDAGSIFPSDKEKRRPRRRKKPAERKIRVIRTRAEVMAEIPDCLICFMNSTLLIDKSVGSRAVCLRIPKQVYGGHATLRRDSRGCEVPASGLGRSIPADRARREQESSPV